MAGPRVSLEVGPDGVALITIVNPPVNSLHPNVLKGLSTSFEEAHRRHDVQAIVVRGASGKFCAGMDIGAIVEFQAKGDTSVLPPVSINLMSKIIEAGPKPVVAAIEGLALGGGLELAMACHGRVAAPNSQLGLVELNLGIIPGFGGTQRLPRLVGLQKGVEMILLAKSIKSQEGKELGLIDMIAAPADILSVARAFALDMANRRRPWLLSLYRTDRLEALGDARDIIRFAREQAKQTAPNVDHPLKCLDAIEEGVVAGGEAGVLKEDQIFKQLVFSDTAKSLTHIFFAQRSTAKVPGVTDQGLRPRPMRKVAVLGGGLMGSGIATAFILGGTQVILKEINAEYLQGGLNRIKANLMSRVKKGKMTEERFQKVFSMVKGVLDYAEFATVDIVIEAAIENIPLKQQIFADLEKACTQQCILSSNTSTIDLNVVGAKTSSQDRIIGAHFFSPAHVMPLLEIVRTEKTSPQVILDLLNVAKTIKKTPVVVGNCTGFAVNRVFFPYTMAACLLADLGVDPYRIDRVIKGFGMPMGPFRLADLVGMGVAVAVGQQFINAFPDRSYAARLIPMMIEDKRLGESNGKGFYLYDEKRKQRPAPELAQYLERSRKAAALMPDGKPVQVSDVDILEMIFFPVINEACRVLDEGVVVRASDLDIATVLGFGFPPYRGGLVFWADLVGPKHIYTRLQTWTSKFGNFFQPCAFLEQRAAQGAKLGMEDKRSRTSSRL